MIPDLKRMDIGSRNHRFREPLEGVGPDDLTDEDRRSLVELAARDARSALLGRRVCSGLALGLLPEGVRHFGRWAGQLQFGRLSILCVVLDRDDRPQEKLRA